MVTDYYSNSGPPYFLPLLRFDELAWQKDAACAGLSTDRFFPGAGNPGAGSKAVCVGCPVRRDCLEFALRNNINDGTWGGLGERARRELKRTRRRCAWCAQSYPKSAARAWRRGYCSDACYAADHEHAEAV